MKANILPIAKSAMKYFFDIDPVITETVVLQALAQGQVLHHELRHAIRTNSSSHKTKIISLIPESTHSWNVA